jgi:adenine phosphoribosyltransferase
MDLRAHVRVVPDFPKAGINFYDIATLMAHPAAWKNAIERLAEILAPLNPDILVGIESRGFLVGAPLAVHMGCGFLMVRKRGKLPGEILQQSYDLEYGTDVIELQPDLFQPDARVVVVDDLLATGGTMAATENLISRAGGHVLAHVCLIELEGLNGRARLKAPFHALMTCPA